MAIAYDGIEVNIQASATKAIQQLDMLASRLSGITSALHGINSATFSGLANGVSDLSSSMATLKSNASAKDFTNLAKNINKLASVNASGITSSASAIREINSALSGVSVPESSAASIKSMTDAMAAFGYERMNKAITNIPLFATEFKDLLTTLSQAPEASQNVISMTNAIANVANAMAGLGKGGSSAASALSSKGSFFKSFVSNLMSANSQTKRFGSSINSLAYSFGKFYANCFLLIRGLKGLGNAMKSAMDYIETFNYYNVTMNKIGSQFANQYKKFGYDSAQAYASSFESRLNELTSKMTGFNIGKNGSMGFTNQMNLALDPQLVMNYEAQVASVTNSVGLMGETSIKASKALTMLAADYSSLRNIDLSTVMTNFSSGLIGQSRALYKYGIDITNATLQTYAYKYGIKTAVSEMTQADKMQLRLIAILDQSKIAWGDQANTINSVANQYRIMKAQASNLARMFGSLFIPMLQAVLPYINAVLIALQHLVMWIASIFHIDLAKNMQGISKAFGGGTDDLEGLADAGDDASDSLDKASDSAKKLAKTVLGFDEINALSDTSSSKGTGTGGGAGGIDLSPQIGKLLDQYNKAWDKALKNSQNKAQELADKLIDYFKRGDYYGLGKAISDWIKNALDSINWDSVYKAADKFGTGLAQFLNGLIQPGTFYSIGRTIAGALNTALHFLDSFAVTLNWTNLGLSIAAGINGFFENFNFTLFAKTLNDWVHGLETAVSTALKNINYKAIFKGLKDFFTELDPDTFAWIVGIAFGPKIAKAVFKAIASSLSKKILANDIAAAIGGGASVGIGGAISIALLVTATVAVAMQFGKDYNQWISNMKQYGSTTGKKVTALENEANPYESTSKKGQYDKSLGFVDISDWQEQQRQKHEQSLQEQDKFYESSKQKLSDYINNQNQKWSGFGDTIKTNLSDALGSIGSKFSDAKGNISTSVDDIKKKVSDGATAAGTYFNTNIQPGITGFVNKIKSIPGTISGDLEILKSNISGAATNIGTYFQTNIQPGILGFIDNVKQIPGNIAADLELLKQNIGDAATSAGTSLVDNFNAKKEEFLGFVREIPDKIKDALKDLYDIGKNAIKAFIDGFKSINIPTPHFKTSTVKIGKFSMDIPSFDGFYANGGFPEDGLFMANHGELVGSFANGKTAVANNQEITEGIKQAVQQGMAEVMMAFSNKGSSTPVIENTIMVDSETLYRKVEQGKQAHDGRYHVVVPI